MGQVINFRVSRQPTGRQEKECKRCPRCGADLWRIQANGKIFCGDCEQAYPLRSLLKSNT